MVRLNEDKEVVLSLPRSDDRRKQVRLQRIQRTDCRSEFRRILPLQTVL